MYRSKLLLRLHDKAVYYFENGNTEEGEKLFKELIDRTSRQGNEATQAALWQELALLIPPRDSSGITRLYCFEKMVFLYKKAGIEAMEIESLKSIADLNMVQGRLDLAEKQLLNVLHRYKSIGYPKLFYVYDLLAVTNRYKGDFSKGIFYSLKAIESMEAAKDFSPAVVFYSRLANMYRELGQTEKSVEWYRKVFEKREYTETVNLYMFRDAGFLARGLIKLKKEKEALAFILDISAKNKPNGVHAQASLLASLAYCYKVINQEQRANNYYAKLVKLTGRLGEDNEVNTDVHYELGQYFMEKHQFRNALFFLQKALNAPAGTNSIADTKEIYLMLFKSDSALGNYRSATQYLLKHMALKDSIFSETKSRQIEELQVRYEIAERKKDIELLNNKNQQAHRIKNIALAGAALLLIIVLLLLNSFHAKQRSNRRYEAHQKEVDQKNIFLEKLTAKQEKLLKEKEWLIDEVHHRVKNNLQLVTSLLNTQTVYLKDQSAVSAVKDSLRRVQTMSIIHQKLYEDHNSSTIAMQDYIKDLVNYLQESLDTDMQISFKQNIEPIYLDVSQAVPLGLIINESVVNAMKYGFPKRQEAIIRISLTRDGVDYMVLGIQDNGIGLPAGFELKKHQSQGLNLVQGLSKQLKGEFSIENNNGVRIKVRFIALNN
ncbi:hypothetical protein L0657_21800 [Dyadobacter sp. CY345]|uniref:histidine kinase dimerization/phosphoacceptor domain -containing protein n=1 Tax=Dyadobacter sp. CY345 TaxID=2909335 RepID=UPI001F3C2436|nr:histidine kinase dimerization/phosphoacceptor domain -containing protein [Dyadobacter sp. CY345]MCF2446607.1 hypothetical protein [Dyadobacter sp. CY345]